jgi:hypothetical protein
VSRRAVSRHTHFVIGPAAKRTRRRKHLRGLGSDVSHGSCESTDVFETGVIEHVERVRRIALIVCAMTAPDGGPG